MTRGTSGATLAALLAAVVTTALCAPSSGGAGTTSATVPPWHNPCDSIAAKSINPRRHEGKQDVLQDWLKQVKNIVSICKSQFNKEDRIIKEVYKEVAKFKKMSLPWLEYKHFDWYKTKARHLQRKEKTGSVLAHMHVNMQIMLATILSAQTFQPNGVHLEKRGPLLFGFGRTVKSILCEVEDGLLNLNETLPDRVSASVVEWSAMPSGDTDIMLKDWGVLDRLKRSIKNWLRVLNDMLSTRPKGQGRGTGRGRDRATRPNRTRPARKPRRKQPALQ